MRHHHHHHHHHHDDSESHRDACGEGCRHPHSDTDRHHHGETRRDRRRGPISRVVRGLAEQFNVHRHVVIAGFVLGFIFVPVLTLLVFLAAMYWTNDPQRVEGHIDRVAEKARASYKAHFAATPREDEDAGESYFRVPDFPALRRRFEELEARAGKMETAVTTEEFSLNRQFHRMDR